jgi:hypothetical protein
MSRESERLGARIRHMRRAIAVPDSSAAPRVVPDSETIADLQARVAHLEQLLQGLQDSVYREGQRQETRITSLEARIEPVALAAALSKDARDRGI